MFIAFHLRKTFSSEKGQLMPFFLVVIVVLLMLSLATVNISKVAFIKTDTANSADAGALAAGSTMASTFNGLAISNSSLEMEYWGFYAGVSLSFAIAITYAAIALAQACTSPCSAEGNFANASSAALAIEVAVVGAIAAQCYAYLQMQKQAVVGRRNAIKNGHGFVFSNSGTGGKLREGDIASDRDSGNGDANNYRDAYTDFLDSISCLDTRADEGDQAPNTYYKYGWHDRQGRYHLVDSAVSIDPVDEFDIRVAIMPVALLLISLTYINYKISSMVSLALEMACGCDMCCCAHPICAGCCACKYAWCADAIGWLIGFIAAMATVWIGVSPGPVVTEGGDVSVCLKWLVCWGEDIVYNGSSHNRMLRVDTNQRHEARKEDIGVLGRPSYPDMHSYCYVNFNYDGTGDIYPPEPRHDAGITKTDSLASGS